MPTTTITDTHTHLADPVFAADRVEVLERARAAGVTTVIAVSENLADARRGLELAEQYPSILPAAGLYPGVLDLGQARNEPANILAAVDAIAEIKELPGQQVLEALAANTRVLYGPGVSGTR